MSARGTLLQADAAGRYSSLPQLGRTRAACSTPGCKDRPREGVRGEARQPQQTRRAAAPARPPAAPPQRRTARCLPALRRHQTLPCSHPAMRVRQTLVSGIIYPETPSSVPNQPRRIQAVELSTIKLRVCASLHESHSLRPACLLVSTMPLAYRYHANKQDVPTLQVNMTQPKRTERPLP